MHRRDYIMKLIEEMTQAIGTVLFQLHQNKKHQEAFDLLESYFARLYLPKSKVLTGLSDTDLLNLFRTNDIIETDKMSAAALLLEEEANVCRAMEREEDGYYRYVTALLLRCEAALQDERTSPSEHAKEIERLTRTLDPYHLPLHLLVRLTAYYETIGRFAQAENMLHRLLAAPAPEQQRTQFHQLGLIFYERLAALPDSELEAGGLPRLEVEEGLKAIQNQFM